MTIRVMVRDGIGSDLFEVLFNDNLCMALGKYVTSEPIIVFKSNDPNDYEIKGSRMIMSHKNLSAIMSEMAID